MGGRSILLVSTVMFFMISISNSIAWYLGSLGLDPLMRQISTILIYAPWMSFTFLWMYEREQRKRLEADRERHSAEMKNFLRDCLLRGTLPEGIKVNLEGESDDNN